MGRAWCNHLCPPEKTIGPLKSLQPEQQCDDLSFPLHFSFLISMSFLVYDLFKHRNFILFFWSNFFSFIGFSFIYLLYLPLYKYYIIVVSSLICHFLILLVTFYFNERKTCALLGVISV